MPVGVSGSSQTVVEAPLRTESRRTAAITKAMIATNAKTFARVQAVPVGRGVLPAIAGVIHREGRPEQE
jgi:hypothetical protein